MLALMTLVVKVGPAAATPQQIIVNSHNAGAQASHFVFVRKSDPARTDVTNSNGRWLATFTDGAYTVSLAQASAGQHKARRPSASHAVHRGRA
jgi:hypothetical protein